VLVYAGLVARAHPAGSLRAEDAPG
jgi:hypothetical protein